ncbi:hypothetical protein [Burkholderia multivorans]|uniref:hypothetical protein n=1 Tax=Burkholderia multivorans TaxID=87883 RepID=UPI00158DAF19|nr:hypothetical protein [Burkholderia multivorans]MDN8102613.1 hypothetical protein [Burkholderia multivorans]
MKGLFIKWTLTFAAIGIALLWVFFPQLRSAAGMWVSGSDTGEPVLQDADLAGIRTIKFLPPGESIVKVAVSGLRVIEHGPGYAKVGLTLTANQPTSLYPNLRIYLQAHGKTDRIVVLSANEYEHQARLSSEEVSVNLTLHPGETGFTASAFYGRDGA